MSIWQNDGVRVFQRGILTLKAPIHARHVAPEDAFSSIDYSLVLTQPCDIEQFLKSRERHETDEEVKPYKRNIITQILYCPLFTVEEFRSGSHLLETFDLALEKLDKGILDRIKKNQDIRYHYFPVSEFSPELIADFKHYFTIPAELALSSFERQVDGDSRGASVLYEIVATDVADRFANYLQRVALPDVVSSV